ncbi:hypothetical protein KVP40.0112 [Vibrio phage KVP40]|uniref:Uncharacterized protein n=3 Tax=Schizotequatrovirus KVP40 TaxID=1914019 RepID=Q6WI40_BPKVM|nr:hypothetical protein KVP40.0112 [Vibrio phage KVP40]AAQ64183.1 hypothetical protein KVP40.0112 [Vibrio phage KVP40]AFN37341.1 hypothetical protein pp2_108 [Vibrio phage phi-pp2]QIW90923.1 hypothetical protein COHAPHLL_00060 [Vibrio phage V09]WOL25022.1 hypothetical protein [Vibrio phage PG216]
MKKQILNIQRDDAKFELYRQGQAARHARAEIIRHVAKNHNPFLVGQYTLYKEHDVKIVRQLLRYAEIDADVRVVPTIGRLPDCLNEIHGIGFEVTLNNDS